MLEWDFVLLGDFDEALHDQRVVRCTMRNRGPFPEFHQAMFLHVDARRVGGMSDIKDNRNRWPDTVCRHLGPTTTDFLLHRIDRIG